ncbi:tetratricopeptide repeat protein [Nostoc sp. DSM 114167]|jgi:tetratricopeptide (TPR) repeat protein|uniref:tetratricopeptide repeat protein n=1 Tax=Nostoc sp. DSM 114167 TaxID=3439050 RepID=UPI00404545FC
MKLKKLAMSSLRNATRSLLFRRSTTTCAHAVLLIIFSVACQPVDKVAIYEKNNGKQPLQAELLAKIAVGYAKLGQQDKASRLLAPAIQTIKINESIKTSESFYIRLKLLEQLGIIYVEMGQYDKALQVAKSLQVYEPKYSDIGLKHITTCLIQVGQYEKALQVAKLISINVTKGFLNGKDYIISQSIVMSEVALKYAQTGQKAQAEQILVQALQKAKTSDEMVEIALKYAQVGQKAKALQLLAQAPQNAQYPDNNAEVAKVAKVAVKYAQVGQQAKGEQLLAQALQSIKKEKYDSIKNFYLADIAVDYAELGQCNQSIVIAKSIKDYPDYEAFKDAYITHDGLILGDSSDVFAEIAMTCAVVEQYEQALQAIEETKYSNNKREALSVLAVEYAKKSQYEQAFQLLKEDAESDYKKALLSSESDSIKELLFYDSEYVKVSALPKIVEQATQVEPSVKAEQVLSQALEVAQTTKSRDKKVKVITAIAIGYAQLKQKDKSEQLLAQALQIAENIHQ